MADKKTLIYCFDAYCGWCYAFRPIMKQIAFTFQDELNVEVLSGGMVLPETPTHISVTAEHLLKAHRQVEDMSGEKFGEDYLWHLENSDESDWFPNSLKPAIALSILKEKHPEMALNFASDLQYALNFEGRDLTDDEAYRHLLPKYNLNPEVFYKNLHDEKYEDLARYDFALVKQLHVTGYPTVLIQASPQKFYLAAKGYADYATLEKRISNILTEL